LIWGVGVFTMTQTQIQRYNIFGKNSFALSMILDSIYAIKEKAGTLHEPSPITVVKNIPVPDDSYSCEPYPLTITGLNYEEWSEQEKPLINLMGVIKPKTKKIVYEFFKGKFNVDFEDYDDLIHPSCVISRTVSMGFGLQVGPLSMLAPFSEIGNLNFINRAVTIGHHTKTGDFCTFNPGCNIAGCCNIGNGVEIGMGANILEHIAIGDNSIIGAGSVVTKSVPANVVVYGVPAKVQDDTSIQTQS